MWTFCLSFAWSPVDSSWEHYQPKHQPNDGMIHSTCCHRNVCVTDHWRKINKYILERMMISAGWWLQILGAFQPNVEYYATMSFIFPICWVKDVQEFFENKKQYHTPTENPEIHQTSPLSIWKFLYVHQQKILANPRSLSKKVMHVHSYCKPCGFTLQNHLQILPGNRKRLA